MRIRITKKKDFDGVFLYKAYKREGIIFPYWSYVALVADYQDSEDPIARLRKKVENVLQKEVTVLEYDL